MENTLTKFTVDNLTARVEGEMLHIECFEGYEPQAQVEIDGERLNVLPGWSESHEFASNALARACLNTIATTCKYGPNEAERWSKIAQRMSEGTGNLVWVELTSDRVPWQKVGLMLDDLRIGDIICIEYRFAESLIRDGMARMTANRPGLPSVE